MSARLERQIIDALIPLFSREIVEVVKWISQERKRQRALQEIADVPVPTIQEPMAADQEQTTKLAESHSSQLLERVERQKSRAEELIAIRKTIKLLSGDDTQQLSKATLPSPPTGHQTEDH